MDVSIVLAAGSLAFAAASFGLQLASFVGDSRSRGRRRTKPKHRQ